MPLELKRRFKQNLQSIPVYIEDTSISSDGYFGITEFPSFLGRGKNGIRVKPSRITLKPESQIYIEVLDVNNQPVYHEIPSYEPGDLSRYISVWVYGARDDIYNTPNGIGEIIICGIADKTEDGGEIPNIFKNVINVRWRRQITISRDTRAESPIIFINQQSAPIVEVSESLSFYREILTQSAQFVNETINQNIVYTSDVSGQNVFLNTPSYTVDPRWVGGKILFDLQNVVLSPQITSAEFSAGMLKPQNYTASIESLVTNNKVRVSNPLTSSVTTRRQSLLKTFTLFSTGSFVVQTVSTGSDTLFSQSLAYITIKDVNPIIGNIDKINVYIKSKATGGVPTEYQLIGTKLLNEPITGSNTDIYSDTKTNLTQSTHTFLYIPPNKNTANDIKIEYLNSRNDFANYDSIVYDHYFIGYDIQTPTPSPTCVTWHIVDTSTLSTTYEWTDCDGNPDSWTHYGQSGFEKRYVCSPLQPTHNSIDIANISITPYDLSGCNIPPPPPVIETASINGTVRYDNTAQTPMTNTTVRLIYEDPLNAGTYQTLTSVITNASGDFNFGGGIPTGSYYVDFYTNKPWGGINATDALNITRHFSLTQPLTGIRRLAADVNASNTINATDALQASQRFAGQRSSLIAGDWVFGTTATDSTFRGWFMKNQPQLGSTPTATGITSSINLAVSSVGIPLTASRGHISLSYRALTVGDVNGSYTPNVNL